MLDADAKVLATGRTMHRGNEVRMMAINSTSDAVPVPVRGGLWSACPLSGESTEEHYERSEVSLGRGEQLLVVDDVFPGVQ